jgi:hypothetical protein
MLHPNEGAELHLESPTGLAPSQARAFCGESRTTPMGQIVVEDLF